MDAGLHAFFLHAPEVLGLFELLSERILTAWPEATLKVQKTQITFLDPRGFCYASLRGRGQLIVSFGLEVPLESLRLLAVANPAPRRFTHHVVVRSPLEVDNELMGWIEESHAVMTARLRRRLND